MGVGLVQTAGSGTVDLCLCLCLKRGVDWERGKERLNFKNLDFRLPFSKDWGISMGTAGKMTSMTSKKKIS